MLRAWRKKTEEDKKNTTHYGLSLLFQSFLGAGHSARVVFEHEPPGAPNVRFDVATPLQLRHVKIKRLLVIRVELGEQFLHVRVLEVPFVCGEEL